MDTTTAIDMFIIAMWFGLAWLLFHCLFSIAKSLKRIAESLEQLRQTVIMDNVNQKTKKGLLG